MQSYSELVSTTIFQGKQTEGSLFQRSFPMRNRFIFAHLVFFQLCFSASCQEETQQETQSEQSADAGPSDVIVPTSDSVNTPPDFVNTLEGVESAMIRIESTGLIYDIEDGPIQNIGGSGFIIDDSGHAITNNHVIAGAGFLEVYVGGESSPRNAKVLSVSECADIALIDIEGEGYPFLEWFDEEVEVGLDVYAVGFPFGDSEFTMTRGIISKSNANGETSWASVDGVVEHDAKLNAGNSGGPLITSDGRVVGINYAGIADTDQYYAIRYDAVEAVYRTLRSGRDLDSIGVSGHAVAFESISGIFVSAVTSGSPANRAGIEMGDLIFSMENVTLATDGSMSDYCDIIRSHDTGDVLDVRVLRPDTQEILSGQLNGDVLEPETGARPDPGGSGSSEYEESDSSAYNDFHMVYDDKDVLEMEVPTLWSDIDGEPLYNDEGAMTAYKLFVSPDLSDYSESWLTPGVEFLALPFYDAADILEKIADYSDRCDFVERQNYDLGRYRGYLEIWKNCGNTPTQIVSIAASPDSEAYSIFLVSRLASDADVDVLKDHIIPTFNARL